MAQRPTNDFDINPNITSGTDLAGILNRFQDAIDSGNSGASRPAYLAAGGMWVKEGSPMRLYLYDGTNDIELYNTTDGIVGGSQWLDNGNDIYYDTGNVGIGTDSPSSTARLSIRDASIAAISLDNASVSGRAYELISTSNGLFGLVDRDDDAYRLVGDEYGRFGIGVIPFSTGGNGRNLTLGDPDVDVGAGITIGCLTSADIQFADASTGVGRYAGMLRYEHANDAMVFWTASTAQMRIDSTGRLGIGGTPSRSVEEIAKDAKDTLARWKSTFDERLKAEPKADKKAVTLEITGDEFSTLPTEKALVDNLTERNIGGGAAKLQVAGDGYFTGDVYANGSPLARATDLIETLSTLREATRDETTLEGLRDALSDAIGGLVQKFEAQISTTES